jgi:hypothetical protein
MVFDIAAEKQDYNETQSVAFDNRIDSVHADLRSCLLYFSCQTKSIEARLK